jgi:hypothetical protein
MTDSNIRELAANELDGVSGGFHGFAAAFAHILRAYHASQDVPYPTGPLVPMTPGGSPVGGNGGGSGGRCPSHH